MNKVKNKKKITSFSLVIGLLIIIGVIFFSYYHRIPAEKALVNFTKITTDDPLFVSPELDLTELKKSTGYVQSIQNQYMKQYGLNQEITPTGFLMEIAETKEVSDKFQQNPSKENAVSLIASYRKSNKAYLEEVTFLKNELTKAFPLEKEVTFANIGSATTNTIIAKDYDLMIDNSKEMDSEIKYREKILNGITAPKTAQSAIIPTKPQEVNNINQEEGKALFTIKTSCFQTTGEVIPFNLIFEKNKDGDDKIIPKIANDSYFQKMNSNDPTENKYLSQGIEWRRIREGNSYRCNDLGYQANLVSFRSFINKYKGNLLFDAKNRDEFELNENDLKKWQEGYELEVKILTITNTYNYSDLELLADYYHYFWSKNQDSRRELNERYLYIKNKQADMELILNTAFSFDNLLARLKKNPASMPDKYKKYLYVIRNNYSYVFLNFSRAVWRLQLNPQYVANYSDNGEFGNLRELEKRYNSDQIKKFEEVSESDILGQY
jgi:hypothetical protein